MKNKIVHPSAYIKHDDVKIIRGNACAAEQLGKLHPAQLELIYRSGWFKLLAPQIYSGQQLSLTNLLLLQEAISWADGSTGWVVTLCNGAGWFGGFLSPEIAEIFRSDSVCLAGSGAPAGTAEITATGYTINGSWKYASGIHHATHVTANCIIQKEGQAILNDAGEPLVLPFIFDSADVNIIPAWKYIGMIATGSDSFEIKDLEVSFNRQFKIDPLAAVIKDPLYLYPFHQLAETTLAVNLSGIAIHFIDLCEEIFREKAEQARFSPRQKAFLTTELENAKEKMHQLREEFYEAADQSWASIQNNETIPEGELNRISITSHDLARQSREIVDRLYPLCGLTAASTTTEINRAWRDLHTASQHALLTFAFDLP